MFELLTATLIDGAFAAVAGLGFAYASSPPKRTLAFCALLAAFAHASRFGSCRWDFLTSASPLLSSHF